MAVFEYKALDRSGRSKKGIVNADSPSLARQKLKAEGLYTTALTEAKGGGKKRSRADRIKLSVRRGVNRSDLAVTVRQLATLLGAGLPLVSALVAITEQMEPGPLKLVLAQVKERVNEGSSLADSMEAHGRVFPATYVALVRAGEASGTLEAVMDQLADFEEQRLALTRKIQSTLAYPVLMLLTGLGVVFFLLTYVIPKLTKIFLDYGQALPLPTVILIAVSNFMSTYWWAIIGLIVLVVIAVRAWMKTEKGRLKWDRMLLYLPLTGPLVRQSAVARFASTLGTLVKNEVPLLRAMLIVREVVGNEPLARAIDEVRRDASEGEGLSVPLARRKIFPSTVVQMISAGEKSGRLAEMLLKVAEIARAEVGTRLSMLTSLLEPIMILGLGVVVAFVVLATLLPIFEMSHLVR